ncbi:hypothetical protein D3C87_1636430 [compost metagenome]
MLETVESTFPKAVSIPPMSEIIRSIWFANAIISSPASLVPLIMAFLVLANSFSVSFATFSETLPVPLSDASIFSAISKVASASFLDNFSIPSISFSYSSSFLLLESIRF